MCASYCAAHGEFAVSQDAKAAGTCINMININDRDSLSVKNK